jgi:UDP:flavonoid glycosyltransferase YjiC (YdhE family)
MSVVSSEPAAAAPLNVLFSVRPFHGHLHPLIPLARAFGRAGHRVAVATAEKMAPVVAAAGLAWLPAGADPEELYHVFPDADQDYGYDVIQAKVTDLLDIAVELFPPDVIIREPTDLAPGIAGEVIGAVNVIYGIGKFIPARDWHTLAQQSLDEVRSYYGLDADPDLGRLYRDLYISPTPAVLDPVSPLPVPALQNVRYIPWEGGTADPSFARSGGSQDRPTVLVTLGTVYNTHSGLFARILEALGTEPVSVICTLGEGADEAVTDSAPPNVRFAKYLPLSSVLPQCSAALCHAGFNTAMTCLHAGVPMVCIPLGSDQRHNATRCAKAGAGLLLDDDDATPEVIRDSVRRVLSEPSFAAKAASIADRMARRPHLGAAVRRVEELAAARPAAPGARL